MSVKYFNREQNKWVIFPGTMGLPGKNGKDGKDAYDIAKENGYEGSREEYMEILKNITNSQIVDLSEINNKINDLQNEVNQNTETITDINGTLSDISEIVYDQHSKVSLNINPSTFETGISTDVTVTPSITINNKPITPINLTLKKGNNTVSNNVALTTYSDTVTTTTKYSLQVELIAGITKTVTANTTSYYPIYYGSSVRTTINITDVNNWIAKGQKKIQENAIGTYTISVTDSNGENIWFCVPNGYSINEVTLNGFTAPIKEETQTIDVPDKTLYKCYSLNGQYAVGTYNFVVTKV